MTKNVTQQVSDASDSGRPTAPKGNSIKSARHSAVEGQIASSDDSSSEVLARMSLFRAGFRHVRTVRRNRAADFGGPPNSVVDFFHEVINISNLIEKQCTTICS